MDPLDSRPAVSRVPLHAAISRDQIATLVDTFYHRIRADARLGPIFDARMAGQWEAHLDKMKLFWASVLLKSGEYKGRPVPAHLQIRREVETDDFRQWLALFRTTAHEVFPDPQAAAVVIRQAEKIATSLWLAMLGTPFDRPPGFLFGDPQPAAP
ncbi:preprotein translocase subunit TatC [Microvirga tunisiensis]|uniref:Preprotein translocase subunit TatC n=2 Tax=Pannonibacter tanglangensis TaxID=2750084 RepID=A0A7X5F580_9HYPH|nr:MULTISPECIES: group III truncated hemoglobin [unclassified Pannonibacter]NBN64498.1 preprotein translocase subunit TatC [Pannonibacter sp. XCT-34]NBN79030.1 preprotein translocase subunit TatC [Pannonibacter sp. XCT-53]